MHGSGRIDLELVDRIEDLLEPGRHDRVASDGDDDLELLEHGQGGVRVGRTVGHQLGLEGLAVLGALDLELRVLAGRQVVDQHADVAVPARQVLDLLVGVAVQLEDGDDALRRGQLDERLGVGDDLRFVLHRGSPHGWTLIIVIKRTAKCVDPPVG